MNNRTSQGQNLSQIRQYNPLLNYNRQSDYGGPVGKLQFFVEHSILQI